MFRKLRKKVSGKGKKKISSSSPRSKAADFAQQPANKIPTSQSETNTRPVKSRELKEPSIYPKKLLRQRSDTAINYPLREKLGSKGKGKETEHEKPSLPTSTSGMQRKKFSLKSTRRHSEYNLAKIEDLSEFQTKLDRFATNVQKFIDAGYEPLIARDYPDILRDAPLITPVDEYKNAQEISLGRKQSVCLFEKDGLLYTTRYVDMINLYNKEPTLVPAKDGPYIFALAAKKINEGESTKPELILELRVIALTTSGHGTLVKNEAERLGIVCAGEFYVNNGKIILIDDKTGNFNDRMSKLKIYLIENFGDDPQLADFFGDNEFNFGGLVAHVMGSAKKDLFYTYAADDLDLPKDTAIAEERLLRRLVDLHYQDPKVSKKPIEPSISTSQLSTFNSQPASATDQQQTETVKPTRKF